MRLRLDTRTNVSILIVLFVQHSLDEFTQAFLPLHAPLSICPIAPSQASAGSQLVTEGAILRDGVKDGSLESDGAPLTEGSDEGEEETVGLFDIDGEFVGTGPDGVGFGVGSPIARAPSKSMTRATA